jgi:hypothetical protein
VLYGIDHLLEFISGVSLWHTPGQDPVPLRWVLVRCPKERFQPAAYFCSDTNVSAKQLPPMDWVNAIIVSGFGIVFAVFYFRK